MRLSKNSQQIDFIEPSYSWGLMTQMYFAQSLNAYRIVVGIGLAAVMIGAACASQSITPFWRAFGISVLTLGLFEAAAGGWLLFKSDQNFAILGQLNDADLAARTQKEIGGYFRSLAIQACIAVASAAAAYHFENTFFRGLVCGLVLHLGAIALIDLGGIVRERALMASLTFPMSHVRTNP